MNASKLSQRITELLSEYPLLPNRSVVFPYPAYVCLSDLLQLCRERMDEQEDLKRQNQELLLELDMFHKAMDLERKADWEKSLKDLAQWLDSFAFCRIDVQASKLKLAALQLRYMADSFTLKANFVPRDLKIKELEAKLAAFFALTKEAIDAEDKGPHDWEDWNNRAKELVGM